MISNNSVMNSTSDRSTITRSKKKKKIYDQQTQAPATATATISQWKSDSQQQVYFSKLHQALRQVRINSASPTRGRAVREAADKALAVTAKGRTRWSRATLMNRLKLKFMKKKNIKRQRTIVTGNSRWQKKHRVSILRLKTKNLPAVQRKVRLLSRLVPGCRKEPFPVILEEATDYISALEMQVRAMTALADLLSASSSSYSSLQPPPAI